jgi:hypothetical protein
VNAMRQAHAGQQHDRDPFHHLSEQHDAPPFELIRDMPGRQRKQHRRHELHQPDQAQVERTAGDRIDLPADRHRQHLESETRRDARKPERDERGVSEQGVGAIGHGRDEVAKTRSLAATHQPGE